MTHLSSKLVRRPPCANSNMNGTLLSLWRCPCQMKYMLVFRAEIMIKCNNGTIWHVSSTLPSTNNGIRLAGATLNYPPNNLPLDHVAKKNCMVFPSTCLDTSYFYSENILSTFVCPLPLLCFLCTSHNFLLIALCVLAKLGCRLHICVLPIFGFV
jgi:hypothetical protein